MSRRKRTSEPELTLSRRRTEIIAILAAAVANMPPAARIPGESACHVEAEKICENSPESP
jgi:hypothetical protein